MPQPKQQRGQTPGVTAKPAPDAPHAQRGTREITEMQKRFCEYLAQGHDQTKAMELAGSKAKQPCVTATKWLKLDKVKSYLASLPQKQQQEEERAVRIANAQDRQAWWTQIMYGDIEVESYDMFGQMTMKRPSLPQRLQASELLAKAQGDFKDDGREKVQPQVVINMPSKSMTPQEIEEVRRANGNSRD